MSEPRLFSDLLGLFKLESTSIVIMEHVRAVQASMDSVRPWMQPASLDDLRPAFDAGNAVSLPCLLPLLTRIHEQDHLKVLSSTPVGLLLWRIEQCLSVDAFYLKRCLPSVTAEGYETFLDAWIAAARGPLNSAADADIVRTTARGAGTIRLFLTLLLDRTNATIGEFIDVANATFSYLARRSGLAPGEHPRWDSKLDKAAPLLGPDQFPLLEVIEASARARELLNLSRWRIKQSTVDAWRDRTIFGVYAPGFNYLMSQLGSAAWTKTAIDLALGSPIDVSSGTADVTLNVEDVLPAHRLPRIVAALREATWNLDVRDPVQTASLYHTLPVSLGMASITDTYRQMADAPFSFEARWGGHLTFQRKQRGPSRLEDQRIQEQLNLFFTGEPHLRFVEKQYRRNFRLRVGNPWHFSTSQGETLHEPLLTFYRDHLDVCDAHIAEDPHLVFSAFNHFCAREISRSYLYSTIEADLTAYLDLFANWCAQAGFPEAFVKLVLAICRRDHSQERDGGSLREALRAYAAAAGDNESD